MKKLIRGWLVFFAFLGVAAWLIGHWDSGYWHNTGLPPDYVDGPAFHYIECGRMTVRPGFWMGDMNLPLSLRLSELSLPGTHDTGTYNWDGWPPEVDLFQKCQTMNMQTQLEAGIRAWDIRLTLEGSGTWDDAVLHIHHGSLDMHLSWDWDVLNAAVSFLTNHPKEIIVMRIKNEGSDSDLPAWKYVLHKGIASWEEQVPGCFYRLSKWDRDGLNPTLADIQGKIVILANWIQNDPPEFIPWEGPYPTSAVPFTEADVLKHDIQDECELGSSYELAHKWHAHVQTYLDRANDLLYTNNRDKTYINFTSAYGMIYDSWGILIDYVYPYFYASGHESCVTGSSNSMAFPPYYGLPDTMGVLVQSKYDNYFAEYDQKKPNGDYEFPHELGPITVFTPPQAIIDGSEQRVFFEGINTLTKDYITNWGVVHCRAGIVFFNFPGAGAIESVIKLNPWNFPPVADLGGPYYVYEGETIQFDASGSEDRDADPLQYRYDFEGNGTWNTLWRPYQIEYIKFKDDLTGTAIVEVRDPYLATAQATADVIVTNVAPTVTPIVLSQPNTAFILPVLHTLTFTSSSSDPGSDDATYAWNFGDGTVVTKTFFNNGVSPDPKPSTAGKPMASSDSVTHAYGAPGNYTVTLTVTDDDGGTAMQTYNVHIADAAEVLQIMQASIQILSSSAFKEPPDQRMKAFANKLNELTEMFTQKDYADMIQKLKKDLRQAMDSSLGGDTKDDWIIDPAAQKMLCQNIDEVIAYLNYLIAHGL